MAEQILQVEHLEKFYQKSTCYMILISTLKKEKLSRCWDRRDRVRVR